MRARIRRLRSRFRLMRDFARDWRRYESYSAPSATDLSERSDARHLECQLTKDYHRVEKGLALRDPKRPFGAELMKRLDSVGELADRAGMQGTARAYAREARLALEAWNQKAVRDSILAPLRDSGERTSIANLAADFFATRRSVRHFDTSRPVPKELLKRSVELASTAPSVCNRQPWLVRFYSGVDASQRVLAFQNGNRGFGDSVPVTALVTVDLRLFGQVGERNQAWIEGGIFAMNLITALHAMNVSSCMLNLSLSDAKSQVLRESLDIAPYEVPIMMIAIGYSAANARVARSPRRAPTDIARFPGTEIPA